MRAVGEERLGLHVDRNRLGGAVEVLRLTLERVEEVLVRVSGLGGEVVPDEALHGVIARADHEVGRRLGEDRREDLEPVHVVPLVLRRVAALDGEAEQPLRVLGRGVDRERHRVGPRHRGDLVSTDSL